MATHATVFVSNLVLFWRFPGFVRTRSTYNPKPDYRERTCMDSLLPTYVLRNHHFPKENTESSSTTHTPSLCRNFTSVYERKVCTPPQRKRGSFARWECKLRLVGGLRSKRDEYQYFTTRSLTNIRTYFQGTYKIY